MNERLETIICGGTAGLVSRFVIAPLDVIKIRLQLQSTERLYTGIYHGLSTIIRNEGIRGLWKGNLSAEILYVSYSATQFLAYTELRPLGTFIAGAGAGAFATTVTYPFDLFRTRFAASHRVDSLYGAIHRTISSEGVRGMYRGLGASIIQIVPYMGLLFASYEALHDVTGAGLIAGAVSKTGVFPLDLIRKRLQVQGRQDYFLSIPAYSNTLSCARQILKVEGIRGFYKGLSVALLKSAPSSAITLWTFETTRNLIRRSH